MEETNPPKADDTASSTTQMTWRPLSINDIKSLSHIANKIHLTLPESDEMFTERITLFPDGCLALEDHKTGQLYGYAVSHPIRRRQPPELDTLLGGIASDADQYYIHDLAILPEARGRGLAQECVEKLFQVAERYETSCLVSVYGTSAFWGRYGFEKADVDEGLARELAGYGEDAIYLERDNRESEEAKGNVEGEAKEPRDL